MREDVPARGAEVVHLLPHTDWTMEKAIEWLYDHLDDGVHCPCCGQYAKRYRRKMYGTQARTLIYAWQHYGQEFFHLSVLDGRAPGVRQADFPKLAYWGLVAKHPYGPTWCLTDRGVAFVQRRLAVPEAVFVYDGMPQGLDGKDVHIEQVLGRAFSYDELMGRA